MLCVWVRAGGDDVPSVEGDTSGDSPSGDSSSGSSVTAPDVKVVAETVSEEGDGGAESDAGVDDGSSLGSESDAEVRTHGFG